LISLILSLSLLGATAECVESKRGEPTVWIKDHGKSHFIHLLEGEDALCLRLVRKFNTGENILTCGCKRLIAWGERDRIRLRCAMVINGKVYSHTSGIYYYYDDGISLPACKKTRDVLMHKYNKKRGR